MSEPRVQTERVVALLLLLLIGGIGSLVSGYAVWSWLQPIPEIDINRDAGVSVARDHSIKSSKWTPDWWSGVDAEKSFVSSHDRKAEVAKRIDQDGLEIELTNLDERSDRGLSLRSVRSRSSSSSIRYHIEILKPSQEWDPILSDAISAQFIDHPIHGPCLTYVAPGKSFYWSGDIRLKPLNGTSSFRISEGTMIEVSPNRSFAAFLVQRRERTDVFNWGSTRYAFILWDISNNHLIQVTSAITSDNRSGIPFWMKWSADSSILKMGGYDRSRGSFELYYSIVHDEFFQYQ